MLEVEHLSKRYGSQLAVKDLSFTAADGCVYGLLGPNGAGKSTTMNIITGYLSPTAGTVRVAGHDIFEEPKAAKAALGYLPEQPPLYNDMTVGEYLDFVAELKGLRPRAARADAVRKQAERTGLTGMERRLVRNLSKGYRQRVGLAAALLGDPQVLILDEPTVGLDPAQVIEVRELIRGLGHDHTVILSSHILSEVQAVCDRVLILSHGELAAEGEPDELAAHLAGGSVLAVTAQGPKEAVLAAAGGVEGLAGITFTGEENGEVSFTANVQAGQDPRAALSAALAAAGCPVLRLERENLSLEDVFLQLTEAAPAEEEAPAEAPDTEEPAEKAEPAAEETPEMPADTPAAEEPAEKAEPAEEETTQPPVPAPGDTEEV